MCHKQRRNFHMGKCTAQHSHSLYFYGRQHPQSQTNITAKVKVLIRPTEYLTYTVLKEVGRKQSYSCGPTFRHQTCSDFCTLQRNATSTKRPEGHVVCAQKVLFTVISNISSFSSNHTNLRG